MICFFTALRGKGNNSKDYRRHAQTVHTAWLVNYISYNAHKIIIFTVPSECEVGYFACVENLKLGTVPHKYQKVKSNAFTAPHVVCFALTRPVSGALSDERWNMITDISDNQSLYDLFPPDRFPQVLTLADPFGILPPGCGPTDQVTNRCTLDASKVAHDACES